MKTNKIKKADFGQDMPGIIAIAFALFIIFGALTIWQHTQYTINNKYETLIMVIALAMFSALSFSMAVTGLWSSRYGKLKLRDKTLNLLKFVGNENILDLGCGKGLLLIEAAKKIPQGKAVGADIWDHNLEYNSSAQIVMENAHIEGVANRVEVITADAQKMPFSDNTFDILMTSLMMHHVKDTDKALNEMVRVTKPGGKVIIADVNSTKFINKFKSLNLKNVEMHYGTRLFFVPANIIIGEKPQISNFK